MRRALMTAGAALLVAAAAGCGGGSNPSSSSQGSGSGGGGQISAAGVPANDHGNKTVSGETKVVLADYYFSPTVLEGKPGEKVTLDLDNQGSVEHTFTLPAQSIDQALAPGKSAKVTVTIPKTGQVSFYCKFHKGSGMAGALASTAGGGATPTTTGQTTTSGGGGYGK